MSARLWPAVVTPGVGADAAAVTTHRIAPERVLGNAADRSMARRHSLRADTTDIPCQRPVRVDDAVTRDDDAQLVRPKTRPHRRRRGRPADRARQPAVRIPRRGAMISGAVGMVFYPRRGWRGVAAS